MSAQIFKQSNMITSARYDFSVLEKRIIYMLGSILNKMDGELMFNCQVLKLKYSDILRPLGEGGSNNYAEVDKALERLIHRTYKIHTIDDKGRKVRTLVSIISSAKGIEGTGFIQVIVDENIVPYFANLLNEPKVTSINLENALSLKSVYSQRFYEFISRWKDTGWWKVTVDELRDMLELEGKFLPWGNFKERVLEQARRELEKKSDVYFKYYPRKTGKSITHLEFKIFKREAALSGIDIMSSKIKGNPATVQNLKALGLSDKQVKEIFRVAEISDINRTIFDINTAKREGRIKTSVAAYAYTVFKEKFASPQAA